MDGAIHRAAGPELLAECTTLGGCPTGKAKITAGYNLPAKHIIHTVGPVWMGGNAGEPDDLASCYRESLTLAEEHSLQVIAFPAISCGVYAYPLDLAAGISVRAVVDWLASHESPQEVRWVLFGQETFDAWDAVLT